MYFDNQEYTIPTQTERKKNVSCLFMKDKNGNRPLDKDIGRVTIKMLHSLNVQLKIRHKAREYTKHNASKRIHCPIYTIKIFSMEVMFSLN